MKCSKCGTECKDTQTFCLCCGSLLREHQEDFVMEEELANSVGALLDEFDDEEDDDDFEEFDIRFDDEAEKVHKELQVENIYSSSNRKQMRASQETEEDDWDYDEDKYFEDLENLRSSEDMESEQPEERKRQPKQDSAANAKLKKKKKKARIAVTCIVVVMVLALTIVIGLLVSNFMHNNLSSYDDYRKAAVTACEEGEYKTALSHIKKALNKAENAYNAAKTDSEKAEAVKDLIEARQVLDDIYTKSGQLDSEYEENLLELIELDDSLVDAYVKLAAYYEDKQPKAMTDFLRAVSDDNTEVIKALEKYIIPVPKADKESGTYTEQFVLTLTSEAGTTIAYTTDGSDPSVHGVTYSEPIEITNFRADATANGEEGVTVVKAIAIDAKGVESKVQEFRYEIVMASAQPQVTPQSGRYDDYTDIVVDVPEGSKCYYTISDDISEPSDPDATSNLYIASAADMPAGSTEEFEPLQMLRGTHTMKFVIIDEYGIVSEVTKRTYILDVEPKISLNAAEDLIISKLKEEQVIVDEEKHNAAGNTIEAQYKEKIIDDNQEYYIFEVIESSEAGAEVAKTLYAVNNYDETIIKDVVYANEKYTIPEVEEETT